MKKTWTCLFFSLFLCFALHNNTYASETLPEQKPTQTFFREALSEQQLTQQFFRIIDNKPLLDEYGEYNKNGEIAHTLLKQFKTDSSLVGDPKELNCDNCPNYGLPEQYIKKLKDLKNKFKEEDQNIIDSLKAFNSKQQCLYLQQKKLGEEKRIVEIQQSPSSFSTYFIVLVIGSAAGYLFRAKFFPDN